MMCGMFIFKQIHFLPRGLPRGHPLGCGRNHIQLKGRKWFYGVILFSNTFTATMSRNIDF